MEKLYLMVALKSNNHCISAFCNLVGRTYPMVTLKSNNRTAFSLCNLVPKKLNASLLKILSSPLSMFNNLQVKHFDIIWLSDRGW